MRRRRKNLDETRVIVEFTQVGHYIKVSAVDPVTFTEVSIVGDPAASQDHLERLAVRKLRYVMIKRGLLEPDPKAGDDKRY